jgi:hypothetical protein
MPSACALREQILNLGHREQKGSVSHAQRRREVTVGNPVVECLAARGQPKVNQFGDSQESAAAVTRT